MAKMLKPTERFRCSHFTVCHLLTSLLVAAILNTRETQGVPTTSGKDAVDNTAIIVPQTEDRYEPYYRGMTSALQDNDLEYSLDYYSEKALMKEYDFDAKNIVKKLADSAMADNTPPNQFLEEIHDLISLQNRSRTEPDENSARDELTLGLSDILKRVTEGWKNELKRLEKKYNVSSECAGRDSVTSTRLALMFPHYLNFGQRPFAVPTEVSLYGPRTTSYDPYSYTTTESSYYMNRRRSSPTTTTSSYSGHEYKVPAVFKRVEFGGLIPRAQDPDQKVLVAVHLYALYGSEQNDVVPFRTKCVMLRRRMEKCVLSDERRKRLLRNNDIYEKSAVKKSLESVYLNLESSDFISRIDWNLFKFEDYTKPTEQPTHTSKLTYPPASFATKTEAEDASSSED